LLLAVAFCYAFTQLNLPHPEEEDSDVVEGASIQIAAFNVQVFGKTKSALARAGSSARRVEGAGRPRADVAPTYICVVPIMCELPDG
jgi:hypothetical protein